MAVVIPAQLRRWLRFGIGVGIVAGENELEILVARARPNGLSIAGFLRVANYLQRPAAEWGADVAHLLAGCGARSAAAVVVLPRSKVVVRTVALPGVRDEDAGRALELQLESLHPLPAEELPGPGSGSATAPFQRRHRGAPDHRAVIRRCFPRPACGWAVSPFQERAVLRRAVGRCSAPARIHRRPGPGRQPGGGPGGWPGRGVRGEPFASSL